MKVNLSHLASSLSSPSRPVRECFERSHRCHRHGAAWTSSRKEQSREENAKSRGSARGSIREWEAKNEEKKTVSIERLTSLHERLSLALSLCSPLSALPLFRSDAASRLRLGHGHAARRNRRRARRRKQARGFDANDVVDRPSPNTAGFLGASPLCRSPDRLQRCAEDGFAHGSM